ncbi:MAG: hypothetical protein WCV87_03865 [Candidatus Paceibacterota bacterium]|jgi:hypothetical protein
MINTKYVLAVIVFIGITGFGVSSFIKKPPAVADRATKNQKLAVTIQDVSTIATKIPETSKAVNASNPITRENTTKKSELATINGNPVFVGHAEFPPEVDSVVGLISITDNIFIGKVKQRIGFLSKGGYPTTQYSVEVLSNIKGSAVKSITLTQGGVGYSPKTGNFYIVDDDIGRIASGKINPEDVYLKTGGTYLFATGYNPKTNIYGISAAPYDRELITTDNALNGAQLLTAAENNPRVQEFLKATGVTLSSD